MASKITTNTLLCFLFLLSFVLSIAVPEPAGSEAHVYSSNLLLLQVFPTTSLRGSVRINGREPNDAPWRKNVT
ncbi:hypothetical protein OPV22_009969 [Ensete ventricosum]|uniref:Purple acid phosphatase Fn3-like domain-containing protein n=1 Tax=Ensete ventricosum TaxID=4639 RepID=A0AAV8REK1_ENSVE|nr:hypothetical protein OPV22_009969 [Ensete ventricosum]